MNAWVKDYEVLGYAIIPQAFTKAEVDRLRALAWFDFRNGSGDVQWRNPFPALMFWPKSLGAFRFAPQLANAVKTILGPSDIMQLNHQYYFRLPGDGDQFAWHQDNCFRAPKEDFDNIEDGYLQTAIIVDPAGPTNGGIHFVPGSHKKGDLNLIKHGSEKGLRDDLEKGKFLGVVPSLSPGDILIWHGLTIHGSDVNRSHQYRSYLMNGFARAECVINKARFPYYIKDGKICT